MHAAVYPRPANAGRVLWAVAASLLVHALLLTASAGRGDGPWTELPRGPWPVTLHASLLNAGADGVTIHAPAPETASTGSPAPGETATDNSYGIPIGLAEPLRYHPARELDVRPQIRNQIEPQFPRNAMEQGQTGTVRLRILIDAQGRVDGVSAPGRDLSDAFAAAAIAAFRDARYTPGIKNGVPVPSEVFVEVQFESFSVADSFRGGRY